jgi:phosphatidylglycerol:prolipoprotein diacylglycerol transferase
MLLYAISRYVIEYYRDDPRGTVGPFSTSQFISLILAPLAVGMLVYLGRFSGGLAHQGARSQRAA